MKKTDKETEAMQRVLEAIELLMDLNPRKNSRAGKFLTDLARVEGDYEKRRYPKYYK